MFFSRYASGEKRRRERCYIYMQFSSMYSNLKKYTALCITFLCGPLWVNKVTYKMKTVNSGSQLRGKGGV